MPQGFTLVELLIVLAIMAGAAAMFVTYLRSGTTGAELRAATRELAAAFDTTRSLAIAGNRVTALVISADGLQYRGPTATHRVSPRLKLVATGLAPPAAEGDAGAIYFFPDGSSTGGLVDVEATAASEAVAVDWFTGHAAPLPIRAAGR